LLLQGENGQVRECMLGRHGHHAPRVVPLNNAKHQHNRTPVVTRTSPLMQTALKTKLQVSAVVIHNMTVLPLGLISQKISAAWLARFLIAQ
jgi:hypothetical protein